jgi:hypothetical protein
LLARNAKKPLDGVVQAGTTLEVLEERLHGNPGTTEHPGATRAIRRAFDCVAGVPVDRDLILPTRSGGDFRRTPAGMRCRALRTLRLGSHRGAAATATRPAKSTHQTYSPTLRAPRTRPSELAHFLHRAPPAATRRPPDGLRNGPDSQAVPDPGPPAKVRVRCRCTSRTCCG